MCAPPDIHNSGWHYLGMAIPGDKIRIMKWHWSPKYHSWCINGPKHDDGSNGVIYWKMTFIGWNYLSLATDSDPTTI